MTPHPGAPPVSSGGAAGPFAAAMQRPLLRLLARGEAAIILVVLATLATVAYTTMLALHVSQRYERHLHVSDAIRSNVMMAHVALEALLAGDQNTSESDVPVLLADAHELCATSLSGGTTRFGRISQPRSGEARAAYAQLCRDIGEYRTAALEQLRAPGHDSGHVDARLRLVLGQDAVDEVTQELEQLRSRVLLVDRLLIALLLLLAGLAAAAIMASRRAMLANSAELERLAFIVRSSTDAITVKRLDGVVVSWNPAAERLYGYAAAEVVGRNIDEIVPEERRDELHAAFERVSRNEVIEAFETERIRRDGSRVEVMLSLSPVHDAGGAIVGIATIARNVGERRRAEAAVRSSEERFRLLAAVTQDLVWEWDLRSSQLEFAQRTPAFFGVDALPERPSSDWLEVNLPPEDLQRLRDSVAAAIASGATTWSAECRLRRDDGSHAELLNRGHIQRGADGEALRIIGSTIDITAQRNAELAMRDAAAASDAANRAKSEFLANMSHEIRTPMNGVLGMVHLTLETELTPEQREYLEVARTSAESLLGIIDDVLDLSKIEAGRVQLEEAPFAPRECLGEVLGTLVPRASAQGLELSLEVEPEVPDLLVGDVVRLRQIVVNLVANAIKFTEHGEVAVRASLDSVGEGRAILLVSVRDTGIGIDEEHQQRIFDAFEQADTSTTRRFGGTGLGLTICAHLVRLLGGRIGVSSTPGFGSTFQFTATFGTVAEVDDNARDVQMATHHLAGLRVLVVEDNDTARGIVVRMLRSWGMVPVEAESASSALSQLRTAAADGAPLTIALVDAGLPGMDGFALLERMRRRPWMSPAAIMMIASPSERRDLERCGELGVPLHVVKPVRQSHLLDAIMTALGEGTVDRPDVAGHAPDEQRALDILLAEDNPVNRQLACTLLRKRGHRVDTAADGMAVLRAVAAKRYDLILMDLQMPVLGGFDATAAIRRDEERNASRRVPIIALTAHAMQGDRERCLAAGMDGYVAKPIQPATLMATIHQVVNDAVPHDGDVDAPDEDADAPIDAVTLLAAADGDPLLARELVAIYLEELPGVRSRLREALAAGRPEDVAFLAHGLKGSSATLRAQQAADAALDLELAARERQPSRIASASQRLDRELDRLYARLLIFTRNHV